MDIFSLNFSFSGLPLFDPDCGVISAESITTLHQNLNSLASLTTVVTAIRDCAKINMITMKGKFPAFLHFTFVCLCLNMYEGERSWETVFVIPWAKELFFVCFLFLFFFLFSFF